MSDIKTPYNMDRSRRLVINTKDLDWTSSPNPMVLRKMLEREKEESGQVTSVVQYKPRSKFHRHIHPLGEEIFVLDGVFQDENGWYDKGTYIRNPPGSAHTPYSDEGCTLFVKLNQFNRGDKEHVTERDSKNKWRPGQGNLRVLPLHEFGTESTALVHWPPGAKFQPHTHFGGEEIFVLEGTFQDELGSYPSGTWIRNPHLSSHNPYSEEGCIIFVKVGNL